jgi:hypothetical protein
MHLTIKAYLPIVAVSKSIPVAVTQKPIPMILDSKFVFRLVG